MFYFSGVLVTRSLVLYVMFYFRGVRVTRSLVLCVMFYFSGVRVTRSLVLCVMFYFSGVCVTRSLVLCVCFVDCCLSFFFWPLCCLFFFYLRILITSLVSSNSSYRPTCMSFCPFSFDHCIVGLSLIDDFWWRLCYLKTFLILFWTEI
jgi:hypothetical protein